MLEDYEKAYKQARRQLYDAYRSEIESVAKKTGVTYIHCTTDYIEVIPHENDCDIFHLVEGFRDKIGRNFIGEWSLEKGWR